MRVRFITDWFTDGVRVHAAGEIKVLDEAKALRFMRRGVAEDAADAEPDTASDVTTKPARRKKAS